MIRRSSGVATCTMMLALACIVPAAQAHGQARAQTPPESPFTTADSAKSGLSPEDSARNARALEVLAKVRALAAAGDTTGATRLLRDNVSIYRTFGPLWFEYANLLAEQSRRGWRKAIMPAGVPNMIRAADSSFATAIRLEPDSVHYPVLYARFLWGVGPFAISKATGLQKEALEKLGNTDDARYASIAADQLGTMMWRRFEPLVGRGAPIVDSTPLTEGSAEAAVEFLRRYYRPPATPLGLALYDEAVRYFRYARENDPDEELYFRHEMMALAEMKRWPEMVSISRARIEQRPEQAWPWLALSLAEHRMNRSEASMAAFDSGLARLPDDDARHRLTNTLRVLPDKKRHWYDSLPRSTQHQLDELFWNVANPSLLLPANPLLAEFRARKVYSELRFTDDETGRWGTTTDKGHIYTRYGPPDITIGSNTWVYFAEQMRFTFSQQPLFGTAHMTAGSWIYFDSVVVERTAGWNNLAILRNRVDSVPSQVARFRQNDELIDVAIFAGIRSGALRRGTPIAQSAIRNGVFFLDEMGKVLARDTSSFMSTELDTMAIHQKNWFVRAPVKASSLRIEALEIDLMQAARTLVDFEPFATKGFGTSDLLLLSAVEPPVSLTPTSRWYDYRVAPLTGNLIPRGAPIALVWETYEPASQNGSSSLAVSVTVQRETGSGLVAIAGRVVGGIRDAVRGSTSNNRVGISYTRSFATIPVAVDHLVVDVGRLNPGLYRVTLTVTDSISGAKQTRMQRFEVVAGPGK